MKYYDFDQVRLLPTKGIVDSRDQCDTSVQLGKHKFKLGVIPANMICSINEPLAIDLAKNGYFYVAQRFTQDPIDFVQNMNQKKLLTSISLGVNKESYDVVERLHKRKNELKVDYITIDVAHGHSEKLERMVKTLKEKLPEVFVIGGNICTSQAVLDLEAWGCDAIKAGIGPGMACTTYNMTNVGSRGWQASMINEITNGASVPIICDGGIRTVGHICASFAMGATMTMVGGLFSGFTDSPGDVVTGQDGKRYKEFFGSASEYTIGHKRYAEGTKVLIDAKPGTLLDYLNNDVAYGIRSCISYLGGDSMEAFKFCNWITLDR